MSQKPVVTKEHVEKVWDRLAGKDFTPATIRCVDVDGCEFKVLYLSRQEDFVPDVYLNTGLSLYVWPRLAAYRYRHILASPDNMGENPRWAMGRPDLASWMKWSAHMGHVVTMSTYKSGASHPAWLHAQSFPLRQEEGGKTIALTALLNAGVKTLVAPGVMPRFKNITIERLVGYPAHGLRLTGDGTEEGDSQVTRKIVELALNYDHFKAFNIVIVPLNGRQAVHFFPRRRTGRAIYGPARWQIAGLEMNGLMQAKTPEDAASVDAALIRKILRTVSLDDAEFDGFLELLETF